MLAASTQGQVSVRESLERIAIRHGIDPFKMWSMTMLEFAYAICSRELGR